MRLNGSAPGPQGAPGAKPFPLPPSGLEAALLVPGFGNGTGNESERLRAAPSSDLDVNTDIYSKVLVTAVYLTLFAVGTVGNSVTAFALGRKKSLQSLQSTVHYHLGSLALSDLLILLLAMPVELYNFIWVHHPWAFGDAGCRGYYFLRDACTYATALNVASLSVERYLAICHPFRAKTLMSRSRTKKFISAIWLASGLLAVPMPFTMGQQNRSADGQHPGGLVCTPVVGTATIKVVIQVRSRVGGGGGEELGLARGQGWQALPPQGCLEHLGLLLPSLPSKVLSSLCALWGREQEDIPRRLYSCAAGKGVEAGGWALRSSLTPLPHLSLLSCQISDPILSPPLKGGWALRSGTSQRVRRGASAVPELPEV